MAGARIEPAGERVRVAHGGVVLVDTDDAWVVDEPGCPLRYYVPRSAVLVPLRSSTTHTRCPWKGDCSYWSVDGVGDDVAWSYESPLPTFPSSLAGWVAFDRSKIDDCP